MENILLEFIGYPPNSNLKELLGIGTGTLKEMHKNKQHLGH